MPSPRHAAPGLPARSQSAGTGGTPLFHAAPRPEHVAHHPAWLDALSRIEDALQRPGMVALVGAEGVGKTLLLQHVAHRIRIAGRVPTLLNDMTSLRRALPGDPDVILIDDADRLPAPLLAALARHGRPILVVSGPDLVGTLRAEGLHPTVVAMAALSWEDAEAFLVLQLANAYQPVNLIQPSAMVQLFQHAAGHPRSLQMLAGLAVFVARLEDAPQVTPAHVAQAALIQAGTDEDDEADSPAPDTAAPIAPIPVAPPQARRRSRGAGLALLGLLAAAGLGAGVFLGGWPAPQLKDAPVPQAMTAAAPPAQVALDPPARPAPAPPAPALPPTVPLHVVVAYSAATGAAAQAAILADALRRAGYQVLPPQMATPRDQPSVTYAFAEDAAMADALAQATGLKAAQNRFPTSSRPGTVRVVLGSAPQRRDLDLPQSRDSTP